MSGSISDCSRSSVVCGHNWVQTNNYHNEYRNWRGGTFEMEITLEQETNKTYFVMWKPPSKVGDLHDHLRSSVCHFRSSRALDFLNFQQAISRAKTRFPTEDLECSCAYIKYTLKSQR